MGIRNKHIIGNIFAEVNDNDRSKIQITVLKSYPEIASLSGRGFSFDKEKRITCLCDIKKYKNKLHELQGLIYEIETKTYMVKKKLKEVKKDESTNTSSEGEINRSGNIGSNKSKNNEPDKS